MLPENGAQAKQVHSKPSFKCLWLLIIIPVPDIAEGLGGQRSSDDKHHRHSTPQVLAVFDVVHKQRDVCHYVHNI